MRVKLMVDELRTLPNDKGYILAFKTQFGEELGCFFPKDTNKDIILKKYPKDLIDVFEVVPYISKGQPGLSVVAPLTESTYDELF